MERQRVEEVGELHSDVFFFFPGVYIIHPLDHKICSSGYAGECKLFVGR